MAQRSVGLEAEAPAALQRAAPSRSLRRIPPRLRCMALFHRVRMLTWPRALLVGLLLAFALNGVAHAAHQHDDGSPTSSLHSTVCGYCVSFDHLTSTPTLGSALLTIRVESFAIPVSDRPAPAVRSRATAQPRAPPHA